MLDLVITMKQYAWNSGGDIFMEVEYKLLLLVGIFIFEFNFDL